MTFEELLDRIYQVCGAIVGNNFRNKSNQRVYLFPRMIVAHHLRMQGWKISDIGFILNRDRTTISYYLKKYDDDYRFNEDFRNLADEILA
jgi:hypothetical protein